ncbi:MAG: hypothetical protein HOO00_05685 [Rhodospirillaceae bacterium]|jgi:LPS-assembly lipoprotein|nr:hypothetical protein [Rhodospirillaceae bacterium]MBT5373728.1 hypothetical protein [Rhodospirillaceae bacterium]MBT5658857.1 hypothetical protein [Rhodospirillaceae bacterium]MBT5751723.1 hypothetical protein [Rhodospirillaceae bacterium]
MLSFRSSLSRPAFIGLLFLAAIATTISTSGCSFRPLYGESDKSVIPDLARIKIFPIENRPGQILRNFLIERLTPKGQPRQPVFSLYVTTSEGIQSLGIRKDETVTRANMIVTASYQLIRTINGEVLFSGQASSTSGYDILTSDYATLSAEKDAIKNNMRLIADDIKTRLSFVISGLRSQAGTARPTR